MNALDTFSFLTLGSGKDFIVRGEEANGGHVWWVAHSNACWSKILREKGQKYTTLVRIDVYHMCQAPDKAIEKYYPFASNIALKSSQFAALSQQNGAEFFIVFGNKEVHFHVEEGLRHRLGDAIVRAGFTSHSYAPILGASTSARTDPNRPVTAAELAAELNRRDAATKLEAAKKSKGTAVLTGIAAVALIASCSVM